VLVDCFYFPMPETGSCNMGLNLTVKTALKSVNLSQSYRQTVGSFFMAHGVCTWSLARYGVDPIPPATLMPSPAPAGLTSLNTSSSCCLKSLRYVADWLCTCQCQQNVCNNSKNVNSHILYVDNHKSTACGQRMPMPRCTQMDNLKTPASSLYV